MEFLDKVMAEHNIVLNSQQEEAVSVVEGANLLLAVPGSGKTSVMILRIGNLLYNHGVKADEILALTFSKVAALDMKKRFLNIFGDRFITDLEFRTIHSFCYQVLKDYEILKGTKAFRVIDSNAHIIKLLYLELNNEYLGEDVLGEITRKIAYCKNMMLKKKDIDSISVVGCDFGDIYRAYESYKLDNRLMDYDDMLVYSYHILRKNVSILEGIRGRYRYINVDEAQDVSFIQHELIKLLVGAGGNIFMVGDEDQSIYGFRGAFPDALLNFKDSYAGGRVMLMEQNYRSTRSIVKAANGFIGRNRNRYVKNMFCENEEGSKIRQLGLLDLKDQYGYIADLVKREKKGVSIGVLFRNNESVIPIVDTLLRENISFSVRENRLGFFSHFVVDDIRAYLDLAEDFSDIAAFERIYYKLGCFISKSMFEYVRDNFKGSIFDTLLNIPKLYERNVKRIMEKKLLFLKLGTLRPDMVVDFIEKDLGYVEYINGLVKKGYVRGVLLQKLNVLRSVASGVKCTYGSDGIFSRLGILEEVMGDSESKVKSKSSGIKKVILSSIHSSKGLEFDRVILVDMVEGVFPSSESVKLRDDGSDSSLYEEEVRLFYVGVTRARSEVLIIGSDWFNGRPVRVSRFVGYLMDGRVVKADTGTGGLSAGVVGDDGSYSKVMVDVGGYVVGVEIKHKSFGAGVIKEIKGDIMGVDFYEVGVKQLLLVDCVRNGFVEIRH